MSALNRRIKQILAESGQSSRAAARIEELVQERERAAAIRAWGEGFDAAEEDWAHHGLAGWGGEECLDTTRNPYRAADAITRAVVANLEGER